MNDAAVGIKCPDCARMQINPISKKRRNRGGLIGLLAATALAWLAFYLLPSGGFGFLVSPVMGFAVGTLVRKKAGAGLSGQAAAAAACGVMLGRLLVGLPFGVLLSPRPLISMILAAGAAWFAAR